MTVKTMFLLLLLCLSLVACSAWSVKPALPDDTAVSLPTTEVVQVVHIVVTATPAPPAEPEPTAVPPVVVGEIAPPVEPEPTAVPPVVVDEVAPPVEPEPTAVPPVIVDKVAPPQPEPTSPPIIAAPVHLFYEQASYNGNCAERPAGTVCLSFSDGFVWLINDAVVSRTNGEPYQGQVVELVQGGQGTYEHVLGTALVRFVPQN